MFLHDSSTYSKRRDLIVNIDNIVAICIEFVNKKDRNIFINAHYGKNRGIFTEFKKYFKGFITKNNAKDISVGDSNLNLFDYFKSERLLKNCLSKCLSKFFNTNNK